MLDRDKVPEILQLLPLDFYIQDSFTIAPALIGCVIETSKNDIVTTGRITETEAYPSNDAASHAFENKHTLRTEVQYSEGGKLYVYQIMGLHLMTSVVVGKEGVADVVFIRSIEPLDGVGEMQKRRLYFGDDKKRLASGPGMLSVALGITKNDNGILVYDNSSNIKIYRDIKFVSNIGTGKRINLGVHGKDETVARISVEQPWRYFDKNSKYLSK